jgi:hypothetical protein
MWTDNALHATIHTEHDTHSPSVLTDTLTWLLLECIILQRFFRAFADRASSRRHFRVSLVSLFILLLWGGSILAVFPNLLGNLFTSIIDGSAHHLASFWSRCTTNQGKADKQGVQPGHHRASAKYYGLSGYAQRHSRAVKFAYRFKGKQPVLSRPTCCLGRCAFHCIR